MLVAICKEDVFSKSSDNCFLKKTCYLLFRSELVHTASVSAVISLTGTPIVYGKRKKVHHMKYKCKYLLSIYYIRHIINVYMHYFQSLHLALKIDNNIPLITN